MVAQRRPAQRPRDRTDPDLALTRTNRKFARRFRAIEARHDHDPERLKALGIDGLWQEWNAVKRAERDLQDS